MTDSHTPEQRSYNMSRIKSKWTAPERILHNILKGNKIRHKMHPPIKGNPDILLKDKKAAIFVHGCFWHKCPKCYKEPKSNRSYWLPKIEENQRRDRRNIQQVRLNKLESIVIWEHDLKKNNIKRTLNTLLKKAKKIKTD